MQNRVPVVRAEEDKARLLEFAAVPRLKPRHDGWTPERQRAFIAALADTGSVTRAAGMVNMAQANCYTLRRAAGAESFAAAWDAALDFGVARLKDVAFERAIDGQLVPRFAGGKLVGFQRKRNDALLMFLLRHYGRDWRQRPAMGAVRARATAKGDGAEVEVSVTREGSLPRAPSALEQFEGVELDDEARAAVEAALLACAERARGLDAQWAGTTEDKRAAIEGDADTGFIAVGRHGVHHDAYLDPWPGASEAQREPVYREDEPEWSALGADAEIGPVIAAGAIATVKRPKRARTAA
jgi:hypothetical protein